MESPALTSTTQAVPSGSWMLQCLAALSFSGARVLQASGWGAGRHGGGRKVRESAGRPRGRAIVACTRVGAQQCGSLCTPSSTMQTRSDKGTVRCVHTAAALWGC